MGCGVSQPPPMRTSVHSYPRSHGPPKEEGADPATFESPLSDTPFTHVNADGEEQAQDLAVSIPVVVTEEERFNKTSEDCDVILDDGEPVNGTEQPLEITAKEVNKQKSVFGREEQRLNARQSKDVVLPVDRPHVASGELWTDPAYPQSVAMEGVKEQYQWKRPKDFLQNPCLYSDGTCRYDIEQGRVGTCWFLSILQSLADQPEYIKHIIPEGSYRIGTPEYDGIFHCRFWQLGDWVDIYVDDFIPVNNGSPWGAKSITDPNELWVTLMEKALSKYYGSYQAASSKWAHRAFEFLTGGTTETIITDNIKPRDLFRRVKNSLACGSILAATVPRDKASKGLTGNHAYSITAVCKVTHRSKVVSLIRLRNPWGGSEGEWTGPWSDRSSEWRSLSAKDKAAIERKTGGDGEFWMRLTDFFHHFVNFTVCNYTPDVDQDGQTDDMNKCWVIHGEWKGEKAAGWRDKMKSPTFEFEIPQTGIAKEGTPVVIELIQPPKRDESSDSLLSLRADLFKVASESGGAGCPQRLLRELTSYKPYLLGENVTYRYPTLGPGKYLVVPHNREAGKEQEFLLRIFSQITLPCREVKQDYLYYMSNYTETTFEFEGKMHTTNKSLAIHGEWKGDKAAGWENKMKNTIYEFEIPQQDIPDEGTPIVIELMQTAKKPVLSLRLQLLKVESEFREAGSRRQLLRAITSKYAEKVTYRYPTLGPGKYLVVPHYLNNPGMEKEFILMIFSQITLSCWEVKQDSVYFICKYAKTGFEHEGKMHTTGEVEVQHGSWVARKNAGGQIAYKSFANNPQYEICIQDPGEMTEQPLSVSLCQKVTRPYRDIGFKIYSRDMLPFVPMNLYWVRQINSLPNTKGKHSTFVTSSEVTADYLLMPGNYLIMVYCNKPDQEASYVLQVAAKHKTNIKGYNVAQLPN